MGSRMQDAETYREKAEYFRHLASEADEATAAKLLTLADDYDALAIRAEALPKIPPTA